MIQRLILSTALRTPGKVFRASALLTGFLLAAVLLPLISNIPIPKTQIDTDPESMLAAETPERVTNEIKKTRFNLKDVIVVAIKNQTNTEGVFTPNALADVQSLAIFAAELEGVVAVDIVSPGTIDVSEPVAVGSIRFDWLMAPPMQTVEEAVAVRERAARMPMLNGTLLSHDGRSLALSIPVSDKRDSHRIARALHEHIATLTAGNEYSITGLPVAQAAFGVQMFVQMAIAAPAAMALIFVVICVIFRSARVALIPLGIAMLATMTTMTALILSGSTIHIMSSMIPIFIMPIAVMDAMHVLSEFADRHTPGQSRIRTILHCMSALWRPMVFTTVTTSAGFASLALAPIPPVQVFGLFVALGVLLAWLATVTMLPAALMVLPDITIAKMVKSNRTACPHWFSGVVLGSPRAVLLGIGLAGLVLTFGLTRTQINDTPMRWFPDTHPIRVAEAVVGEQFSGAHVVYLSLSADDRAFLNPEMLSYVEELTAHVVDAGLARKSLALPDLIRTIHRDLVGKNTAYVLPNSAQGVAQVLMAFENSHKPADLWKFVTPDYAEVAIWFQMDNGDNLAMRALEAAVSDFRSLNPPPTDLRAEWFGLTYLNAVWQDLMVSGMLKALAGSFLVIALLLFLQFRSVRWAAMAILPLSVSIGAIYGSIGWMGRDFDMPIVVLSTLSLGLAVDFAIHFVTRFRQQNSGCPHEQLLSVYREPARAIHRNTVVLGIGFLPLLLSPLVPYRTVGVLIPTIIILSAIVTLALLGAILASAARPKAHTNFLKLRS